MFVSHFLPFNDEPVRVERKGMARRGEGMVEGISLVSLVA